MGLSIAQRVVVGVALIAAVLVGATLAGESMAWAAGAMLVSGFIILAWARWGRASTLLLAFVIFGYVVGNRGFAQLRPIPNLPLLFGEIALAAGLMTIAVRGAFQRTLPLRYDALNLILGLFLIFALFRLRVDAPRHGFLAIRDAATIYYMGFFFVTQSLAREAWERRWLTGAFTAAVVLLPAATWAAKAMPDFFEGKLLIQGIPVIYLKDDLVATFMMAGSFLLLEPVDGRRCRLWRWFAAGTAWLSGVALLSRAALAGFIVGLGFVWYAGRRRMALLAAGATPAGLALGLGATVVLNESWEDSRVLALYEHVVSILDFDGSGQYRSAASADTGDNNTFRLVWWRSISERVWHDSPLFGLGFGYDLSADFIAHYDLVGDDFSTRSPHNVGMTILGRMGFLGGLLFSALLATMAHHTMRLARAARRDVEGAARALALWAAVWVIMISACFGVVLEGPMGAVVFWCLLGIANERYASVLNPAGPEAYGPESAPAPLPSWQEPASARMP